MRRTAVLRLLVIDRSELAKNMYELLFRDLPGYRLEFAEDATGLGERKRRARPHLIVVNSNALQPHADEAHLLDFAKEFPTLLISAPDRLDLKSVEREYDTVTLVEKPFYPYDLITVINRLAAEYHPLSGTIEPAPAPKRRRFRRKAQG